MMRDGKPACDMADSCTANVTHVEDSGFIYCAIHGQLRQQSGKRCRKLRPHEVKKLARGETLTSY